MCVCVYIYIYRLLATWLIWYIVHPLVAKLLIMLLDSNWPLH